MRKSSDLEKREFLLGFYRSASFLSFKDAFSEIIRAESGFIFFDSEGKMLKKREKRDKCITRFIKGSRLGSLKKIRAFNCSCNKGCLVMPIMQGGNRYGYMAIRHLKKDLDKRDADFMNSFMYIAVREFQKEQELNKLYETIRPRAIALSTIHTVHRLLTSTLDLDELIERIARLTCQVVRARYCSIMLLDESKHHLIPKAVIDFKDNTNKIEKKYRKEKTGVGYAGKVAKTGKSILLQSSVYVPLIEEDIIGVISARNKTNNEPFSKFDLEILLTLAEQAVIAIKNAQHYEEQKKMAYGSIKSLAALLDTKSLHTFTHSEQFVEIILAIAKEMNLPREEIRNLRYAALLPDTGRFSIPDEILKKQGRLSKSEFSIVKKQHLESLKILEPLEFLKPVMPIIMYHHERYDGAGYPEGLKGKKIPLGARIMAVAEAFEAMVSSRPYKSYKISIYQALKEIEDNRGTQFDPDVVDVFMAMSKKPEFKKIF